LVARGPQPFVGEALPEFLAGRQLWAQGFSEPGAGSDLASLRTTARRTDEGWVVNGRKIWTSWARYATWCLLLARTGAPQSRHRGLTAFVVDLRAPGVEVRAIEQANGTDELAEVAFDDVHITTDRIVGEVGGGWQVAMHILSHERAPSLGSGTASSTNTSSTASRRRPRTMTPRSGTRCSTSRR
jgi:alkylation response protein AidB-like acyl-CoA dehydrogenase